MFSKKIVLFLGLGVVIVLGVFQINKTQNKTNESSLADKAKESLMQIADTTASQNDLIFKKIQDNTNDLALRAKDIYENSSIVGDGTNWKFNDHMFKKDGRYLNKDTDISTVFVPNFVVLDTKEKGFLERTASLDLTAPNILKSTPDAVATWITDEKGAVRYYPNIVLGSIMSPDYDAREDVFYKPATPAKNPGKETLWSALYDDVAGQGLMISVMAPVYTKDGFVGVFGTDVVLKNIIKTISEYKTIDGSYAFLISKDGQTIAFPDQAYKDILNRQKKEKELLTNLTTSQVSDEFAPILKRMTSGLKGVGSIHSEGKELFIAYSPLKQTGFSVAIVADAALMLKK